MVKGSKSNLKYKKFHLNLGQTPPFAVKVIRGWNRLHRDYGVPMLGDFPKLMEHGMLQLSLLGAGGR